MAVGFDDKATRSSFGALIHGAVINFSEMRTRRAAYNRVFNELNALGDAELAQMKVARSMIHQIAKQEADLA